VRKVFSFAENTIAKENFASLSEAEILCYQTYFYTFATILKDHLLSKIFEVCDAL
jgi:hypothetical protein